MAQRTLTIIKPDAVEKSFAGKILSRLEGEGFRLVAGRKTRLTREQAQAFYEVHKERPFYADLVEYMISGPVWVVCLERPDAVVYLRQVMGDTDAAKATPDTIRGQFGESIERNAIHGSDSDENAAKEIAFFFPGAELL